VKFFDEFKHFVQRGNVIDLAVGIIMGAAFTGIVTSLVNDIMTPPIGYLIRGVDFTQLSISLPQKTVFIPDPLDGGVMKPKLLEPATINVGKFIQAGISFLITAFCVFVLVKAFNTFLRRQANAPSPPPTTQEKLLIEIRDLLQQRLAPATGSDPKPV
jgi:large conductance mechanosensitive channel